MKREEERNGEKGRVGRGGEEAGAEEEEKETKESLFRILQKSVYSPVVF